MQSFRRTLLVTLSSFAFIVAPIGLVGTGAALAKGGNSGSHGNSGSNTSSSGSHGNSDSGGNSGSHGNSGSNGNSGIRARTHAKNSNATNSGAHTSLVSTQSAVGNTKEKNLNAMLAGLNSLHRNPNALLHSRDPRMVGIVNYAKAVVTYETSLTSAITDAQASLMDAQAAIDTLNAQLATLQAAPVDETTDPDGYADWQAQIEAINTQITAAQDTLQTAQDDVTVAETAYANAQAADFQDSPVTDETALTAAIIAAANRNRVTQYGAGYPTPQMITWVENAIGVGSSTGIIDTLEASN